MRGEKLGVDPGLIQTDGRRKRGGCAFMFGNFRAIPSKALKFFFTLLY